MIAPAGGYIMGSLGWHAVFIVLTVIGVLIFFAAFSGLRQCPDTTLSLNQPVDFLSVFLNPQFYTYCLTSQCIYRFIRVCSRLTYCIHECVRRFQKTYGWIFAMLSIGFIGSSQLNNLILKKFSSPQILKRYSRAMWSLPCFSSCITNGIA
jgi:DHA1 family bicyclomycin/chloramphenicol resistance-like MFS transporter